ncbi:MAG TPA: GNAT family N-acetyltransferase, partial [Deferrisomatales bacterium]|nr:GNAT family N-acetyltransferase [Deferrisomatales bacterium]
LRRLQSAVDLVVARVDTLSARRCFGSEFLHVPEWVGTWLPVPRDPEPLARAPRSLRDDLRFVRNSRLQPRLSRQEAGFEEFYRDMYVPFIHNRHGEFSHPHGYRSLRRAFRQGGLLWAERDGQKIAGALFETSREVLHFRALGTAGGDPALVKRGGLAALYGFMVDHARAQGCARVDLGTNRALLQDGVLRYKRKWGAVLADRAETRFELLLGWNRLDGAALAACASTSPIFRGPAGLAAIHVLDTHRAATSADAEEAHRAVWIPGLHRLCLVSTAGWQPGATAPPDTVLAIPMEAKPLLLGSGVPEG